MVNLFFFLFYFYFFSFCYLLLLWVRRLALSFFSVSTVVPLYPHVARGRTISNNYIFSGYEIHNQMFVMLSLQQLLLFIFTYNAIWLLWEVRVSYMPLACYLCAVFDFQQTIVWKEAFELLLCASARDSSSQCVAVDE